MNVRAKLILTVCVSLCAGGFVDSRCAAAEPDHSKDTKHSLWVIESAANRVFLMGSVHVLRDSDYPLPQVFYEAYDEAEQLVMEIDLANLDPIATLALSRQVSMLAEDTSLATVLGPETYQQATELAQKCKINLELFSRVEPWYAAMTISQLQLQRLGFRADNGIEFHFMQRAQQDGKAISGLELVEEQFGVLDKLPLDAQIGFFLEALTDGQKLLENGEQMLTAWKTGDSQRLNKLFAEDLNSNPRLRQTLLVERNLKWLPKLIALTTKQHDFLVIVGALHLVGEDGIIGLLRENGFVVRQL